MVVDLGPAVVVAIDHGLHWGVYEGFENPRETLERILESEPDGILASVPFLRHFDSLLDQHDIRRIATLDLLHDSTLPGQHETYEIHRQVFDVQAASRVGADAAKVVLAYGREDPAVLERNIGFVAEAAEAGKEVDVPLVVEPTLWGQRIDDDLDPELLADANRIAFELGADVLKSPYPGSREDFAPIVENAPVPIYIAGGPATGSDLEVLEMVHGAVEVGANGVMFGRNIWQREDPAKIIGALKAIIHDGASVTEAEQHL